MITFKIQYNTKWGESLALVPKAGTSDALIEMRWNEGNVWSVEIKNPRFKEYEYVLLRDGKPARREWTPHTLKAQSDCTRAQADSPLELFDHWNESRFDNPSFRGAGTAIPVFALRSEEDFGIGDFRDLHALVDWAARTGQTIIQLLPVNDTTRKGGWDDSYPYSPVSSFALHPIYIRLQDAGVRTTKEFKSMQKELNTLNEIDYPRVFKAKMQLLEEAYTQKGAKDLCSPAYRKFYKDNAEWLGEYCEFCALRDASGAPEFHAWIQFHLDRQLSEEVAYARGRGISFMGDLPIGISSDSADAHWHPELFNLDSSAGAPPDFFSADGQNWGFPTYDWDAMESDGYRWWKARLRKMSQYFDAFRIDHILGFFRIWEIPLKAKSGKDGHFNPALPYSPEELEGLGLLGKDGQPIDGLFNPDPRNPGQFQPRISPDTGKLEPWQKERYDALYNDFFFHRNEGLWEAGARKKLPALLGATSMLACGEDLGMVPACVPGVMTDNGILSLEMPMMDKGRPWPRRSLCATTSHDLPTLRMEFEEDPSPAECRRKLMESLTSASMLAIFPLQDWLATDGGLRRKDRMEERINEPADPKHHWRYRLHLNLSELISDKAEAFNCEMEGMLKDSGRFHKTCI